MPTNTTEQRPTRALWCSVLSLLVAPMKRVELIVRLDREKTKKSRPMESLPASMPEFPDVSMGSYRFDICSAARGQRRVLTTAGIWPAEELRSSYGPNKILPNGRKIYVINTLPKFFDISTTSSSGGQTIRSWRRWLRGNMGVLPWRCCALFEAFVRCLRTYKLKTASSSEWRRQPVPVSIIAEAFDSTNKLKRKTARLAKTSLSHSFKGNCRNQASPNILSCFE